MSCRKRKPEISTSTRTSEARSVLPRSARSSQDRDISVKICTGFLSLLCIMNKHPRQTDKQTNQPTKRFSCMHHLPPRWQGYFCATMLRSRRKEKKKTATPFFVFVGSTAARCSPFPFLRGQPPVLVPLATVTVFRSIKERPVICRKQVLGSSAFDQVH
jgi:hypothetical protein